MDASVIVALFAALASAAAAVVSALVAARGRTRGAELEATLDRHAEQERRHHEAMLRFEERLHIAQEKRAERQLAAREQLDRYREPLLEAATALHHRIHNIRSRAFLVYLSGKGEHRAKIALLGTSYRLARYLAVVQSLRRSVNLLRFEREEDTKVVNSLLDDISEAMASDRLDGLRLMVWRDEQRAIGELACNPASGDSGVADIGFATFVELHAERFAPWLSGFEDDLQTTGVQTSPRLAKLQELLGLLIAELEKGRTYSVLLPPAPQPGHID